MTFLCFNCISCFQYTKSLVFEGKSLVKSRLIDLNKKTVESESMYIHCNIHLMKVILSQ